MYSAEMIPQRDNSKFKIWTCRFGKKGGKNLNYFLALYEIGLRCVNGIWLQVWNDLQ